MAPQLFNYSSGMSVLSGDVKQKSCSLLPVSLLRTAVSPSDVPERSPLLLQPPCGTLIFHEEYMAWNHSECLPYQWGCYLHKYQSLRLKGYGQISGLREPLKEDRGKGGTP